MARSRSDKVLLTIGNNSYQPCCDRCTLQTLRGAVNDSNRLAELCDSLGFVVHCYQDLRNKEEMLGCARQVNFKSRQASFVVFHYSGHAAELNGKPALIPCHAKCDCQPGFEDPQVYLHDFLAQLCKNSLRDTKFLLLIDGCRIPVVNEGPSPVELTGTLRDVQLQTVFACGSGRVAYECDPNGDGIWRGIFSLALEKCIRDQTCEKLASLLDDVKARVESGRVGDRRTMAQKPDCHIYPGWAGASVTPNFFKTRARFPWVTERVVIAILLLFVILLQLCQLYCPNTKTTPEEVISNLVKKIEEVATTKVQLQEQETKLTTTLKREAELLEERELLQKEVDGLKKELFLGAEFSGELKARLEQAQKRLHDVDAELQKQSANIKAMRKAKEGLEEQLRIKKTIHKEKISELTRQLREVQTKNPIAVSEQCDVHCNLSRSESMYFQELMNLTEEYSRLNDSCQEKQVENHLLRELLNDKEEQWTGLLQNLTAARKTVDSQETRILELTRQECTWRGWELIDGPFRTNGKMESN